MVLQAQRQPDIPLGAFNFSYMRARRKFLTLLGALNFPYTKKLKSRKQKKEKTKKQQQKTKKQKQKKNYLRSLSRC
jgi:acetyl-CoA carboxylase carboxyltransferase component